MAFLQQQQRGTVDGPRIDALAFVEIGTRLHGQQEAILEQRAGFEFGTGNGQGRQDDIELALQQLADQRLRQRLAQLQLDMRMTAGQRRQDARQEIRRDGGDDAEAERSAHHLAGMPAVVEEIPCLGQDALRPAGDLPPFRCQADAGGTALHQGDAKDRLQLAHLHGQGRLRHGHSFGGTAEMQVAGKRIEIAQLSKRDHRHWISLSPTAFNTIDADQTGRRRFNSP